MAMLGANAAPLSGAAERPTLVVGIVVEGLDENYLSLLADKFGTGGFRKLLEKSAIIEQLDYGTFLDAQAATALLYTGSAPTVNGIPGAKTYEVWRNASRPTLTDSLELGNFTTSTLSPRKLLVSTLADEIKIDGSGATHSYAIAADPQQAIIMAGHASNGGYWIDDINGQWASTTFYGDVPQTISLRNYNNRLSSRLDTLQWRPLLSSMSAYPDIPSTRVPAPFRYQFQTGDPDRYRKFKSSPSANTEITDLATELIHYQMLGQHPGIDMLSLAYSVAPYPYSLYADQRVETMDSYLRLDRDLEKLFKAIDARKGNGSTLVFLAGIPARTSSKADDERWKVPTGQFSARKAKSLLNMYLMAIHGNGEWVSGYHDRNFYLNHNLIKEHKLDATTVREQAAQFLNRMSGVSHAYTIDDVLAARVGSNPNALRRNTSPEHSGDVIISINPGWEAVDDLGGGGNYLSRDSHTPSMLFIMGPGITPTRVTETVDARRISPTIARLLRIRSPNSASEPAVRF